MVPVRLAEARIRRGRTEIVNDGAFFAWSFWSSSAADAALALEDANATTQLVMEELTSVALGFELSAADAPEVARLARAHRDWTIGRTFGSRETNRRPGRNDDGDDWFGNWQTSS